MVCQAQRWNLRELLREETRKTLLIKYMMGVQHTTQGLFRCIISHFLQAADLLFAMLVM